MLQAVSHVLLLNLRHRDLLCRLAGDRFVVLLPNTGAREAQLLAEELRLAQNALSAITGEFTSDDLLGVIFSSFCIGK